MALWYGRHRFVVISKQPESLAVFGLLLAVAYGLYQYGFPLYAYFALHHAFNEAYLRNQRLPYELGRSTVTLRSAAIVLHFIAVLLLISNPVRVHYEPVLWVLLGMVAIVWVRALSQHWPKLNISQRIDQVMLEVILLVLLPIAHYYPLTLFQVVCYHVVFWSFYPLLMLVGRQQLKPLLVYLTLTVVTIGGFLAISPVGISGWKVPVSLFYSQFIIWSWLHITLAFATSSAFPHWITRWFAPRKPASV